MILYLLLVLRKINWMFLPQVEHCGETKTEMRGMVSAEIYHWALTKKQLFTSFFWKAWLDYLITFTRRLAKQRLQFLFSFFFLSRHQGKTAKWFNLNFNTIDYWFYPEPVNENTWKAIAVSQIWYEGNIDLDFCLQDRLLAFCESGRPLGGRRLASPPPGMEDHGGLFPLGSSYTQVITNISNIIIIMIILIQRRRFCPGSWL